MTIDEPGPGSGATETDVALVRAAQHGDTTAMSALLDRLIPHVGRICGPIALHSGPDATQEALIVILRALPTLREPRALFGWARTIAAREAVRYAKRDQRASPTSAETLSVIASGDDPELGPDVHDALDRLSPEHRAVLVLRYVDGLDEAEAAAVLDVPVGTVKSRVYRARAMFRKAWPT